MAESIPAAKPGTPRAQHLIAVVLICGLGALAYSNGTVGEFVLDDIGHIPDNPHIRMTELGLVPLWEAATRSLDPQRPLAYVTFAFNYYWGGDETRGYHLFNIAVHLVNGVLVYALALLSFGRLQRAQPETVVGLGAWVAALVAALVFTLHPIQTQAVTYVVQRMTSLSVLFYLLALLAWLVARSAAARSARVALFAVAGVSWLLALSAKPIAITLPVVIGLYEWFLFQDLRVDWLRRRLPILAAAAAGLTAVAWVFASADLLDYSGRDFDMGERVLTQLRVVALYLGLVLLPLPSRLNLSHDISLSHSLIDPPSTLVALVLLVGLVGFAIHAAPRQRLLSLGLCWCFVNLMLESSILPLELVFEHRMYLPMVGVSLLAGDLVLRTSLGRRAWVGGICAAVVLGLGVGTYERNRAWQSALILWADASAKSPGSYRAQYDYGVALYRAERLDEAARQFEAAVALDPDAAEAQGNLGVALVELGRLDEAERALERAAGAEPGSAERRYKLGAFYASRGLYAAAVVHFRDALRLDPEYAAAASGLAAAQTELMRAP